MIIDPFAVARDSREKAPVIGPSVGKDLMSLGIKQWSCPVVFMAIGDC